MSNQSKKRCARCGRQIPTGQSLCAGCKAKTRTESTNEGMTASMLKWFAGAALIVGALAILT